MRVMIGYDGSASADAIFDDLKFAGLPTDSQAQVVSAADLMVSSPPVKEVAAEIFTSQRVAAALKRAETYGERVVKEAEEFAAKASERLKTQFPGWNIESLVVNGAAEWELLEQAKRWKADLIVVGSQGRLTLGRLFLGSVSRRMTTDAHCSVRVARFSARKKENAPARIIIGVDGSPAAREAVLEVGRRVWQEGTMVRLVAANDRKSGASLMPMMPTAAGIIAEHNQSQMQRAEAMIEWARYELKNIGINISMSIQQGSAKRVLLREAEKWKADCIFVGTRNFSGAFERLRLGSVSTAVVTNAPCSVEIVRPSETMQ